MEVVVSSRRIVQLLVVFLAAIGATVAWAMPASAEPTVAVETESAGTYQYGGHIVVRVTITADRLVQGKVVAAVSNGNGSSMPGQVEQPVEVQGNTTKEVRLVIPASEVWQNFNNGNGGFAQVAPAIPDGDRLGDVAAPVTVKLIEDGTVIASQTINVGHGAWREAVAVLPVLAREAGTVPREVRLRADAGEAALSPIDLDVLSSAAALDAFDTVAAAPDDLVDLSDAQRAALFAWLDAGGHLVIDAAPGTRLDGLPAAWQPGAGGWSYAGAGDIRLIGRQLAGGGWEGALDASADTQTRAEGNGRIVGWESSDDVASDLGDMIGLTMPNLTILFVVLGVYLIIAGPVVFTVLRRKDRQAMAWVVVPALSMFLSAALVVVGGQVRPDDRTAHVTIIETGEWGAYATTTALLSASGAGDHEADVPAGWAADVPPAGDRDALAPLVSEQTADGVRFPISFDSGQSSLVRASGPVPSPGTLAVEAMVSGDTTDVDVESGGGRDGAVVGTVRNTTNTTLRAVVVGTQYTALLVGDLAPGQSKSFRIAQPADRDNDSPIFEQWDRCRPCGDQVSLSAWSDWFRGRGRELRKNGVLHAVGWTDQLRSAVRFDGTTIADGRTAVVSRSRIGVGTSRDITAATSQVAVRPTDLRNARDRLDDTDLDVNGPLVRVVLPPTITDADLEAGRVRVAVRDIGAVLDVRAGEPATNPRDPRRATDAVTLVPDDVVAGVASIRVRPAGNAPVNGQVNEIGAAELTVSVSGLGGDR